MLKGFRDFIVRGNVLDLAVAVVIGAAFTAVVNSVVKGFINPLIAALFGKPNLDEVANFTINNATFSIGTILTALVNFILVAATVYFFIVMPYNKIRERFSTEQEEEAEEQTELLREIRDALVAGNKKS